MNWLFKIELFQVYHLTFNLLETFLHTFFFHFFLLSYADHFFFYIFILYEFFCILTRVGLDWVFLTFLNYIFFLNSHPLIFYVLEIEFFLFSFSFYEVKMFSFNLLENDVQVFFLCFFFIKLSQSYIHSHRVFELM